MISRFVIPVILALLPAGLRRRLGCRLLGWDVHPTARIGHSIISAARVHLGPGVMIGHFNVVKGLEELRMGPRAAIHGFNWVSGPRLGLGYFPHLKDRYPALVLGEAAAVLNRHVIDCSATVTIGDYSVLGGSRSVVLTHGVDLVRDRGDARPVVIGDHVAVMTNCVVLAGATIARCSIIAAGSVVDSSLSQPYTLYRGNPAEPVRELSERLGYFNRDATWRPARSLRGELG